MRWTLDLMSDSSISIGPVAGTLRRRYSLEFKRRVVQESMASGASIAAVAMAHGLNANQLHNWRWQYRRGDFGQLANTPTLLPIHITGALTTPALTDGNTGEDGRIELYLGHAKIVVHGVVDLRALQGMIELLRP